MEVEQKKIWFFFEKLPETCHDQGRMLVLCMVLAQSPVRTDQRNLNVNMLSNFKRRTFIWFYGTHFDGDTDD